MKLLKLIVMILALTFVTSCATVRQGFLEVSQEEVKNVETAREVAKNYLEIWPMQSGLIRGALGTSISEMPAVAIVAMDQLDRLASKKDEYTDLELGYSLGLRVRMMNQIVIQALRIFAPDVLTLLSALAP